MKNVLFLIVFLTAFVRAQTPPDTALFSDSARHWYFIRDEAQVIDPQPHQERYSPARVADIADNILLYQKSNGGWPKNYDMLAVLTPDQKTALANAGTAHNTTFDNGATHSQVAYLAKAHALTGSARFREGCLRGIDFMLAAQYPNGGWPQFFPDTAGYARYITFNDGAMIGVMTVLHDIVQGKADYAFVDEPRRRRVERSFRQGLDCMLRAQITENGVRTAWCQQHDHLDLRPQHARAFEPAAICNGESSQIVLFLMSLQHPDSAVVRAVESAVAWFTRSRITGVRVETVRAPRTVYRYHTTSEDRVLVRDPGAPPVWARLYELGTHRPLFCNRDSKPVYSLAEVDRERRTGYRWYVYDPQEVLDAYPAWAASVHGQQVR